MIIVLLPMCSFLHDTTLLTWNHWRRENHSFGNTRTFGHTVQTGVSYHSVPHRRHCCQIRLWWDAKMSSNIYKTYIRPHWGVNKWKKNGGQPFSPLEQYHPFREVRPLKLRNYVAGQGKGQKESPCIPQMMKLFECLQKNEYDQSHCSPQLEVFQDCYQKHLNAIEHKKMGLVTAEPVPGRRDLTTEQLNTLFRRYPQKN